MPILRMVVPFALGILMQRLVDSWLAPMILSVVATVTHLLIARRTQSPSSRLKWRVALTATLAIAAMALGWITAIIHYPQQLTDEQLHDRVYCGRVTDLEYTDFSMRMTVDVLNRDIPHCKVLLSTRGCDYTMKAGDVVIWQANLKEAGSLGNPDEMDYASYLIDSKGVRYQQHLPVNQVKRTGHSPTLFTRMANSRRALQLKVFNSVLSPSSQQFIVAILLGNSDFIDKATRQEFSAAGVAHVLALSGLHVGFISLIIWWLLFPLDYFRLKKLRLIITLAAVSLFAVYTGLSPSVVRSTIMIGMVFISFVFYRRSVSLNALALAALIILVFNPSAVYSVGFQLSFITIGAILIFARLPKSMRSRYKAVNYVTSTAITSIVAMLATLALNAYYFHTVSIMSVLANLAIVPILPFFMVFGALFLLVTVAGLEWGWLNGLLDIIYQYIHWVTGVIEGLPWSHIGGIYVTAFGVMAYFAILLLVILWFYFKDHRFMIAAGAALAIMLLHSLWIEARTPHRGLVIFNSYTSTPILYYNEGTGFVWDPDDADVDSVTFARYYSGFLAHHDINRLRFFTDEDTLLLGDCMIKPPYAYLMGHRMMVVGSGRWKHMTATNRMALDEIIITKRFHASVDKLRELYDVKRVVVSGAYHEPDVLYHDSDTSRVKVHDLARHGAFLIR